MTEPDLQSLFNEMDETDERIRKGYVPCGNCFELIPPEELIDDLCLSCRAHNDYIRNLKEE